MRRIAAILLLFVAWPAAAHEVGLSRGKYVVRGDAVHATITLARAEVQALQPGAPDAAALRPTLERLVDKLQVSAGGAPCPGALGEATFTENDGLEFEAAFRCAAPPTELRIALPMLAELSPGHRHLGSVLTGAGSQAFIAHRSAAEHTLAFAGASSTTFGEMFVLGVEHILTGYDHLLFLLALVLVGGRVRSIVGVVTAFTVAHSITLAIAALGIWAPDPDWVEPAIALSIAYVGVENFFVGDASHRWRITFPFGLLHGFGFAGVLAEIGLPRDAVASTLVAFNLGVEAGQLAVLAVVLPVLWLARRQAWFAQRGVLVGSAAVVCVGLFWFIERVA